jgi:hypothetical protein
MPLSVYIYIYRYIGRQEREIELEAFVEGGWFGWEQIVVGVKRA